MAVHAHSMTAAVDPKIVWERWTDVEHWPADNPSYEKARLNGPLAKGALGWVKSKKRRKWSFRIVEVDRQAMRFVIDTRRPLATVTVRHELGRPEVAVQPDVTGSPVEVDEDARVLTHTVTVTGPLAALWDRATGRGLAAAQPAVLANIVAAATE